MFDPFNTTDTANSPFWDGESFTYEKLVEVANQIPRMEFVAFTMNPIFERRIIHSLSKTESTIDSTFINIYTRLRSMNAYVVPNQSEGCIKWKDKDLLNLYLEMMEMRETEQTERRQVLHTISAGAGIDYSRLVLATLKAPTEHLIHLAPLVVEAAEVPRFDLDLIMPKLEIQMPKKIKGKGNQNEPFYAKFIKKRKDRF